MAELLKMLQSSNGAFKSDLMNSYVAKHKGSYSSAAPGSGFPLQTGAAIFPPSTTTNTTTTSNTTGGIDTPDNANIMLQNRTADNNQNTTNTITTSTTGNTIISSNANNGNLNANNGNKNRNINTTSAATTTTTTPTSTNNANNTACPEQPDSNANVSEVNAVLEEVKAAMSEHLSQLVQQVTDATVDAHMDTCLNTHKAVAEARARFEAMKKGAGGAAPMNMPDMSKLSVSAGSMWEKMMDQMMPELGKAIKFCKSLPGFSELPMEDQMKLIKHGSFDVMMTRFAMLIDNVSETMLDPSHKMVVPRQVIKAMPMGEFLDGFFHVGQQFNPVGLTDGEIGLFSACLIFNPSRPGLSDVKLIAGIQSLYQQALFNHMKQNHSDREEKFSRVLKLVPMFRRINEEHSKALGAMKMQQGPDAFDKQFPPMHKEMYLESQQKQN